MKNLKETIILRYTHQNFSNKIVSNCSLNWFNKNIISNEFFVILRAIPWNVQNYINQHLITYCQVTSRIHRNLQLKHNLNKNNVNSELYQAIVSGEVNIRISNNLSIFMYVQTLFSLIFTFFCVFSAFNMHIDHKYLRSNIECAYMCNEMH